MPQSETQHAYLTVTELRRLLRVVLPHLDKDPTLPVLGDVEVTMAGHSLTMAATDRFTLAAAWTDLMTMAPATDWTNTVSGRCLAVLARILPRTKASADTIVTITTTDEHLAVQVPNQRLADFAEYPTWTIPATGRQFIKWRPIIDRALAATDNSAGASLNPALMTRWAHLADDQPIHVLMTAPRQPIVLIGAKAIGLQMPLRTASGLDAKDRLDVPWHTPGRRVAPLPHPSPYRPSAPRIRALTAGRGFRLTYPEGRDLCPTHRASVASPPRCPA